MKNERAPDIVVEGYRFSPNKYEALAFQRPAGLELLRRVEDAWPEWVDIIEEASWRRLWTSSPLMEFDAAVYTPSGRKLKLYSNYARIALLIFSTATWGYGVAGWLRGPNLSTEVRVESCAGVAISKLRGVSTNVTAKFDHGIFHDTGLIVPIEIGTLDRWLEPMWRQAKDHVAWQ